MLNLSLRYLKKLIFVVMIVINGIFTTACSQSTDPVNINVQESDLPSKTVIDTSINPEDEISVDNLINITFENTEYSITSSNLQGIAFMVECEEYDKVKQRIEVIAQTGSILVEDDSGKFIDAEMPVIINTNEKVIWSAIGEEKPNENGTVVSVLLLDLDEIKARYDFAIEEKSTGFFSVK